MASDRAVSYGNNVFLTHFQQMFDFYIPPENLRKPLAFRGYKSGILVENGLILVLPTKRRYSSLIEKVFVLSIENFQNFQWLSHKIIPISQTECYFENI